MKDAVLEFLANFNPGYQSIYTRGHHYPITPSIVAQALKCGHVLQSNERTYKEWIKEYSTEVAIRELSESLCLADQVKWLGKKDKVDVALSVASLKYLYKAWVNFLKERMQPNITTTFNVWEMVTLTVMQEVAWIPWAKLIFNHLCTMCRTKQWWRPSQTTSGAFLR